jgi:hypothetical protein
LLRKRHRGLKSEIPNSKSQTNSNDQNPNVPNKKEVEGVERIISWGNGSDLALQALNIGFLLL